MIANRGIKVDWKIEITLSSSSLSYESCSCCRRAEDLQYGSFLLHANGVDADQEPVAEVKQDDPNIPVIQESEKKLRKPMMPPPPRPKRSSEPAAPVPPPKPSQSSDSQEEAPLPPPKPSHGADINDLVPLPPPKPSHGADVTVSWA